MSSLSSKDGTRSRHVAGDSMPYETISIDKLTPIIGAEIGGVDLAKPLSNRTADEIHRALAENIVIFFRDQHITPQQHLAFGRLFGELHVHPAAQHSLHQAVSAARRRYFVRQHVCCVRRAIGSYEGLSQRAHCGARWRTG